MTGRPAVIIEKQNNGTGGSPGAGVATASFSKAAAASLQVRSKITAVGIINLLPRHEVKFYGNGNFNRLKMDKTSDKL